MEPKGEKTLDEVRQQLKDQVKQCLDNLEKLKNFPKEVLKNYIDK